MAPIVLNYPAPQRHARRVMAPGHRASLAWLLVGLGMFLAGAIVSGELMDLYRHRDYRWPAVGGVICGAPFLAFLLVGVAWGLASRAAARRRAVAILTYVEQAVRLHLPLSDTLRYSAEGERRRIRVSLRATCESLDAGVPVAAALEANVPEMPQRVIGLLRAAEQVGQLPPTLRRLLDEHRRSGAHGGGSRAILTIYPVLMVLALTAMAGFMSMLVLPAFRMLLARCGIQTPRLHVMESLDIAWNCIVWLAIAMGMLIFVAQLARFFDAFAPAHWISEAMRQARDGAIWRTPFLGRMGRDRELADVFHLMADAMAAGYPLDRAIEEACGLRLNGVLRRRMQQWLGEVRAGSPPAEAARRSGLPPLISGMLATAHAAGNPELMRFLANYYETRFSRLAMLLQAAAVPAMALVFGVLTALVAMAVFGPLVKLTEALMPMGRML